MSVSMSAIPDIQQIRDDKSVLRMTCDGTDIIVVIPTCVVNADDVDPLKSLLWNALFRIFEDDDSESQHQNYFQTDKETFMNDDRNVPVMELTGTVIDTKDSCVTFSCGGILGTIALPEYKYDDSVAESVGNNMQLSISAA